MSRREPYRRAETRRRTAGRQDRSWNVVRSIPIESVLLPRVIESDDEDRDEHDHFDEPRDAERSKEHGPRKEEDHFDRSEEHTSELQSLTNLVCRLLLEKKKKTITNRKT